MGKWEEYKIDDIAHVKGGKRLPKGDRLIDERTKHPYIRVSDFNDNGSINISSVKFISESTYKQIANYFVKKEDVYIKYCRNDW